MKTKNGAVDFEGQISIIVGNDGVEIQIHSKSASLRIIEIKLSSNDFVRALGRLGYLPCECRIMSPDRANKTHEHKSFEFELPESANWRNQKEIAIKTVDSVCPEGWEPDHYFGAQDSFRTDQKTGKTYAKTHIRRWIESKQS